MLSNGAMIAISMIWLAMSTLTLSARIYTRFVLMRNPGADDYIIIFSWVSAAPTHARVVC